MKQPGIKLIHYAGERLVGQPIRPASALLVHDVLAYFGDPAKIDPDLSEFVDQAEVIDQRDRLVIPAMVNAHTHLELTDIGPQPYVADQGFVGWVKQVREARPASNEALADSVRRGAQMARESGVYAVGDIASSVELAELRHEAGLRGNTYLELFGMGDPFDRDALDLIKRVEQRDFKSKAKAPFESQIGWQPHAPYSAGHQLFADATWYGPSCTHLAETKDEAEFIASCTGPLFDYLNEIGRWDDSFACWYGKGLSPVQWMRMYLAPGAEPSARPYRWLVAHCNYVDDDDIKLLAETKTAVAYCPIASEYFGHKHHRYRDMLEAGINICLGTDSIVCADPDDPQPLGLMGAMRRLYQRDGVDPDLLLKMATTNGADALRMRFTNSVHSTNQIVTIGFDPESSVDPFVQALTNDSMIETQLCNELPGSDERKFDGSPRSYWLHRLRHHGPADGDEPA